VYQASQESNPVAVYNKEGLKQFLKFLLFKTTSKKPIRQQLLQVHFYDL
jgi:hypothetical protein